MDGSRSCLYVVVKYILIAVLAINLINLIVAIPSGLSSIDDDNPDSGGGDSTTGSTKKPNTDDDSDARKVVLVLTSALNILFIVLGLVGVSRENFCLSLTVAILLTFETVASFFTEKTPANILVIVFNVLATTIAYLFAYLCRQRQREEISISQVEPITSTPVAYYTA